MKSTLPHKQLSDELEGSALQAILYVSHGSRNREAISEAIACIAKVKRLVNVELQEICFLELAEPNLSQGIESLVTQGATRISIVPVLLLSAGHYYTDIPEEINRARAIHKTITFTYGKPLGVQKRFAAILTERIEEVYTSNHSHAKVLLVGRGSRNPQTMLDIEEIGNALQEKVDMPVEACYLAVCEPSFHEAIESSLKEGYQKIIVVPYLWFTGVLMRFLEKEINNLPGNSTDVLLCRQLGDHPYMVDALKERAYEAVISNYQI